MSKPAPAPTRILVFGLLGAFFIYCTFQLWVAIQSDEMTDWMYLSGVASVFVCLSAIGMVERRVSHAVADLIDGGVLVGPPQFRKIIHADIDRTAARAARAGGLIAAGAAFIALVSGNILMPWLIQRDGKVIWSDGGMTMVGNTDARNFAASLIVALLTAALAGYYLGKFAAYGRLQQRVEACNGHLLLQPGADDNMGGLQPLVIIVRGLAVITLVPVAWLALWLVLTAAIASFLDQYGFWRLPIFILLPIAVFYATRTFFTLLRMMERMLVDQEVHARTMDGPMGKQVLASVANARRHIRPRSSTYLFLLAVFAASIVISAYLLPSNANQGLLSLFFFGPL